MPLWLKIGLLGHLLTFQFVFSKDCQHSSFYIENNAVVEGKLLEHFQNTNLNECATKCSTHSNCNAANFVLSLEEQPVCMLVDSTKNGSLNELPTTSIYALKGYCLDKKNNCHNREWSYEKFANYDLIREEFLLGTYQNLTLRQCLNSCTRLHDCEAALYSQKTNDCRLSKVNLNNVNGVRQYFKYTEHIDLYENNCPKRPIDTTHCSFTRINQAGFVDIFDHRIQGIKTLEECEEKCLDWNQGPCRSYTYNNKLNQCFLSHASQKALGRSVLDSLGAELSSGELDDCINFKLDCQGKSLKLMGQSMKLFKGSIQSRKGRKTLCERNVTEDYRFEVEFLFDKCGIEKQKNIATPTFLGQIFVKEGSTNLITIHDKVLEVKCQIQDQLIQQDNQLSFHFEVEDQNASISLSGSKEQSKTPKYKLEVLNSNGDLTSVADMHKNGFLLVDSDGGDDEFIITSLVAEDSINQVELVDSKGCVTNTKMITSMERISPNKFKIGIVFSGFPDQSSVTYQTLIKPCKRDCELECNKQFYKTNITGVEKKFEAKFGQRKRRSVNIRRRHIELSQEVYRVRRTVITSNLDPKKEELTELVKLLQMENQPTSANKNILTETISTQRRSGFGNTNFWQCFTEDISCMFTMVLALMQIFLIISCSFVVYKYTKKWVKYYKRRNHERRPSSIDGDPYDYGDASILDSQTSTSFNNSSRLTQTTNAASKY